jgi:cell division protein FtsW
MIFKRGNQPEIENRHHGGDAFLLAVTGVLSVFGLIMLFSASPAISYIKTGDSYYYAKHQLMALALGLAAFLVLSKIDYRIWKKYAFPFLFFSVFLLILVFIPGLRADWGTAQSWINIFGFSIQPSEFVKLSFLIYLSAWLEQKSEKFSNVSESIGPFAAVLGSIIALMILQPDLGTLSIIAATSLIVYFVAGGKTLHVIGIIGVGILGLLLMLQMKPYQMDRFKCLADPSFDTRKTCYQVNQSLIAVGSGGFFGRGLGASRQKFMYLPEVIGDSIFAVIGEELGFAFSVLLLGVFLFLAYRGWLISKSAPDPFGKFLAIGIVAGITIQALVNIGGVINLIPLTGVPLPLISYGGTSVITTLSALGLLYNISKQTK